MKYACLIFEAILARGDLSEYRFAHAAPQFSTQRVEHG